jgi:hypothetical protein
MPIVDIITKNNKKSLPYQSYSHLRQLLQKSTNNKDA